MTLHHSWRESLTFTADVDMLMWILNWAPLVHKQKLGHVDDQDAGYKVQCIQTRDIQRFCYVTIQNFLIATDGYSLLACSWPTCLYFTYCSSLHTKNIWVFLCGPKVSVLCGFTAENVVGSDCELSALNYHRGNKGSHCYQTNQVWQKLIYIS